MKQFYYLKEVKKDQREEVECKYCCAVNCHSRKGRETFGFFRVIRKRNHAQTDAWIRWGNIWFLFSLVASKREKMY